MTQGILIAIIRLLQIRVKSLFGNVFIHCLVTHLQRGQSITPALLYGCSMYIMSFEVYICKICRKNCIVYLCSYTSYLHFNIGVCLIDKGIWRMGDVVQFWKLSCMFLLFLHMLSWLLCLTCRFLLSLPQEVSFC